jgi:hypothetical protein
MADFNTEAELSITVPDRELRQARQQVEESLGTVEIGAGGGARADGGGRQARQQMRLADERNGYLERIDDRLEDIEDLLGNLDGGGQTGVVSQVVGVGGETAGGLLSTTIGTTLGNIIADQVSGGGDDENAVPLDIPEDGVPLDIPEGGIPVQPPGDGGGGGPDIPFGPFGPLSEPFGEGIGFVEDVAEDFNSPVEGPLEFAEDFLGGETFSTENRPRIKDAIEEARGRVTDDSPVLGGVIEARRTQRQGARTEQFGTELPETVRTGTRVVGGATSAAGGAAGSLISGARVAATRGADAADAATTEQSVTINQDVTADISVSIDAAFRELERTIEREVSNELDRVERETDRKIRNLRRDINDN